MNFFTVYMRARNQQVEVDGDDYDGPPARVALPNGIPRSVTVCAASMADAAGHCERLYPEVEIYQINQQSKSNLVVTPNAVEGLKATVGVNNG
jgi:hypothetical protein